MTIIKKHICISAVLAVLLLVFPPSIFLQAKAENLGIIDGSYQVELSFSPFEGFEENPFKHKATLTVKDGQYQLTLALEQPYSVRDIHIEQLGNEISWTQDIENLVQFDVWTIQDPIVIKGTVGLAAEESYFSFTQELRIEMAGLTPNVPLEENKTDEAENLGVEEAKGQEWAVDYVLLADGKNEPSIMNNYVNPIAKVIENDGRYYVQMTILQSAWVTGLEVDYKGNQIEPKQVSLLENVRIVEFEVEDLTQPLRMWVKIDIPDISYHHQYFVQLAFNQKQIASLLHKPFNEESTKQVVQDKPVDTVKEQVQKPQVQISKASLSSKATQTLPAIQSPLLIPKEEKLTFDRTLDEPTDKALEESEDSKTKEETTDKIVVKKTAAEQPIEPLNIVKIIGLIVICLVSGWLLIKRIRKTKNETTEQK
ncbi:NEAT domain-containing protein [Lysinibacillus fusiformis]|uniref:NEAT domain-containing protein n=1 Tax=Lysinibacillus fusiformis TaxID=28031 RepID=UPI00215B33F8|nr:NEAT domain-containing protein [Lysinibacillus fusiformis]MCR8851307.1 NEAT domain-containing protein [Lysinibacillus fusiformis]